MAGHSNKVAVSIEGDLFRRAEALRKRRGETRSGFIAHALRRVLDEEDHDQRVQEYVAAYARQPESVGDEAAARKLARRSLAHVEWETS